VDWRTPTSWTARLDMTLAQVQAYKGLGLEKDSIAKKPPLLDELGRAKANSPTIGSGSALPLPKYIETPKRWDIGLGPRREGEKTPEGGLTLRIAGSTTTAGAGEKLVLRTLLTNESAEPVEIAPKRDAVLTYHFRYLGGHYDKQELYRCRVELPEGKLEPGKSLDLTKLRGWKGPVNGKLGDAFHLRTDTKEWKRGCRMRATARFVGRAEETAKALQRLDSLLRSKEVLRVSFR